jgi:hypothetical protein
MDDPKPLRPRARLEKNRGRFLNRVAVDIVDLRVIETELLPIGPVKVTSDQFEGEAASVDEFAKQGYKSLEHIKIEAKNPDKYLQNLSVDFDRDRAFIHSLDNSDHLLAAVELRVEQICRARVRRSGLWAARLTLPLVALVAVGILALSVVAGELEDRGETTMPVWWLAMPVVPLLLACATGTVAKVAKGEILLVSRDEAPGWFARNRDGLAVQFLGGVGVLVLGIVIGRLS